MRRVAILMIMVSGGLEAAAAEFHLKDGSIVVGSIISLVDGEDLIVDTAHMDEVTIEWEAIDEIRGTQAVDVVTYDNRRFIGTVVFDEGNIRISGEDQAEVAPADVFSIDELKDGFWDAVDVYTDLGINIVRGNNQVTQLSFGGGVGYEGKNFETAIDATSIINEQTDTTDTRRNTLTFYYTHDLTPRWQTSGFYQFESDEQQGLEGRSLLGGYVGNRLLNSRRQRFDLYAGFAINSEQFEDLPQTETPEGLVGVAYRRRAAADIDASLTLFPNLEESGRLRAQFDASMSFDLFSDLDFKITGYNRYDSDPPEGNEKNDSGITLGLSWEY